MNCSRCHDHMYDAIQQREYFQLRAIFEPYDIRTDRLPGQADTAKDGLVRAFDAKLDATTVVFTRGDEKQPDKDQPVGPNLPKLLLASGDLKIAAVPLPPAAYYPSSRGTMGLLPVAPQEGSSRGDDGLASLIWGG